MNKVKILLPLLIFTMLFANSAHAYDNEIYLQPTRVEIHKQSTNTLTLNGLYKVTDKASLVEYFVTSNGPVAFAMSNNEVSLTHLGASIKSLVGFNIDELKGSEKVVVFSTETIGRKSAISTSDPAITYKALQGGIKVGEFTNSLGELWYNLETPTGTRNWVPSTKTMIDSIPTLSLGKSGNGNQYRGSFEVNKLTSSTIQTVNKLDIEQYLRGVVASEMPSTWHLEALKAQAIAARGYALKSTGILSSTTSSQVYKGYSNEVVSTNRAIDQTKGKVLLYTGKLAQTYFYSTSGGRTANVGDVWNSNQASFPYLVSVDDSTEVSPYSNWKVEIPASSILTRFGYLTTNQLLDVKITKGGANGEVTAVTIVTNVGEKTIAGNESVMRGIFTNPLKNNVSLNSNWYDISFTRPTVSSQLFIQSAASISSPITSLLNYSVQTAAGISIISNDNVMVQTNSGIVTTSVSTGIPSVTVTGKGYGHRIGMSQYGAKAKADGGWNAEQILKHYYTGTTIGNVTDVR